MSNNIVNADQAATLAFELATLINERQNDLLNITNIQISQVERGELHQAVNAKMFEKTLAWLCQDTAENLDLRVQALRHTTATCYWSVYDLVEQISPDSKKSLFPRLGTPLIKLDPPQRQKLLNNLAQASVEHLEGQIIGRAQAMCEIVRNIQSTPTPSPSLPNLSKPSM